jgi:hypothetical protein
LLPVIRNLIASGLDQKTVGILVGYQGSDASSWFKDLKRRNPSISDAVEEGKQHADAALLAAMTKSACGYRTKEVRRKYKFEPNPKNHSRPKKILVEEQEIERDLPPDKQLAMFLAMNHMPEFYKNKVELEKKTLSVDLKGTLTSNEIEEFAGKLGEYAQNVKKIESKVIDMGENQ